MRIFNDLIDLGTDINPTVLLALNVLVAIHLVAFVMLIAVVLHNMRKSDQRIFIE